MQYVTRYDFFLRSKSNVLAYRFYQNVQRRIEATKRSAAEAAESSTELSGHQTSASKEEKQEEITIILDKDRKDKGRRSSWSWTI